MFLFKIKYGAYPTPSNNTTIHSILSIQVIQLDLTIQQFSPGIC